VLYEEIAEGARENAGVFDARGLVGISFTRQQRFCGDWRPTHVLADGNGPLAPYVWDVVPVATTFAVGVDFALHELLRRCKHDLVGVQANVYDVVSGVVADQAFVHLPARGFRDGGIQQIEVLSAYANVHCGGSRHAH